MNWYYGIAEKQYGPVDLSLLIRMAADGRLHPEDLVWNEKMGEKWAEARTVPELVFPQSAISIPPPPVGVPTSTALVPQPQAGEPAGMLPNAELTRRARASLAGRWGLAVGVMLLQFLFVAVANNVIPLAGLILGGPLMVGVAVVFIDIVRGGHSEVGRMFEGFKCFGNALGTYLLTFLFVILWTFLLIIPGIIAGISYSMVYFILADHPGTGPMDAIRLSKEMMHGYKWQYFCLGWRFLGWILLSLVFTLGIGMLWVSPYMQTSYAHFYEMVRRNYYAQQPTA